MYVQFIKDEEGNCIVEYAYYGSRVKGMTQFDPDLLDRDITHLLEEHKLFALERNGEMVPDCLGFKSVARHVKDNKIFGILMKEGEYHDEANNLHLRIIHPVDARDITVREKPKKKSKIDSDSGSDNKSEGWEDSWAVRGIKPKLKFRETIIKCVVDNGYVDSADKVNPIDDWHYQLMAKVGFWEKNAVLISRSINDALEQAGWNMTVEVRVSAKDDASFIIDITKHSFGAYYALVQYDSNFGEFERDVQVSRKPDELYLQVIRKIFMYEDDRAARVEDFKSLLEDGHCEACDDDYVMEFRPRLLLRDGNIVAENLYDVFKYHEPIEYVELPDFDEEEDPQEAHDEFMENLEAEGKNLYCLNVK